MTAPRPRRARLDLGFRWKRWLVSGRPRALDYLERESCIALWDELGEVVTARHIARWPLSRPVVWWRYSAPRARRPGETERQFLSGYPDILTPGERRRVCAERAKFAMVSGSIDAAAHKVVKASLAPKQAPGPKSS